MEEITPEQLLKEIAENECEIQNEMWEESNGLETDA